MADVLDGHQPDSDLFAGCHVLADYSISAWLYVIQLRPGASAVGSVFLVAVDGTRGDPLARSFTEFGRLYLDDPTRLYPA